ncbi:hypothetical protein OS242_01615 [Tumebacillus sp. DT12]|uniref:Uncharacterized protein n=1 Tax=Tumebacillus lacus TaxID=2995335 RepID=A0ABT3WVG3_9BACL|nr:hypothetical protein [Tumebacillus lacus]MCX7568667.1 hypothetical protein [Tumebacillus lacus]
MSDNRNTAIPPGGIQLGTFYHPDFDQATRSDEAGTNTTSNPMTSKEILEETLEAQGKDPHP